MCVVYRRGGDSNNDAMGPNQWSVKQLNHTKFSLLLLFSMWQNDLDNLEIRRTPILSHYNTTSCTKECDDIIALHIFL